MNWRKSSRSTANGQCVEVLANWHKAIASGQGNCVEVNLPFVKAQASGNQGDCVEAALTGCPDGDVHIRDSKDPDGPQLVLSPAVWIHFIKAIKAGELT